MDDGMVGPGAREGGPADRDAEGRPTRRRPPLVRPARPGAAVLRVVRYTGMGQYTVSASGSLSTHNSSRL
ncbi:hypothetical protein GCM10010433_23080 [Streptomyces pulveraceus]